MMMLGARRLSSALVGSLLLCVGSAFVPACSCGDSNGSSGTASTGTETTSSNGSTGSGFGGSSGTLGASCHPACTSPMFCSVDGSCLNPGMCHGDADCGMGQICDIPNSNCIPGGGCGSKESKTTPIPPNLLIVLDRSCSMTDKIGAMDKWQIAVAALENLMTTYNGQIRFGITLFPDKVAPNCGQSTIPFPPGPGNEAAISALLTASLATTDPLYPSGPCVTNIDTAIEQAQAEPALTDTTRKNYVLLLTDGEQSGCNLGGGNAGTTAAITAMAAAGIPTFVIGFGSSADPVSLTQFADAGGEINTAGPHDYYDAADQTSLSMALDNIANATIGCTFALTDLPPDPSKVFVFFDNVSLPEGPPDGWTYDPATNSITFLGAACAELKAGTVMDVHVVYGCNQIPPN